MKKLCTHCRHRKAIEHFHSVTAPFCKACNTDAGRIAKYKREVRSDRQGFLDKLHAKEQQIADMLKALKEIQV